MRPIRHEELLENLAWVQRLARKLVGEPSLAEDLSQDVWVKALEDPPRARAGAGLRAWLARVTRNAARHGMRSAARRSHREQVAARTPETPSASDVVARGEAHRLVIEALMGLEEPDRSVVLLHYLDGSSAVEIGRKMGLEAAAVRQRLSRAMRRLRARLERKLGDSDRLQEAMLPLLGAGSASSGLGTGKAVAAGVLLLTMVGVAWHTVHTSSPVDPRALVRPTILSATECAPSEYPARPGIVTAPRTALQEQVVDLRSTSVLVRVTEPECSPVPGARVRTFEDTVPAERLTDAQGVCALPFEPGEGKFRMQVEAEGHVGFLCDWPRVEEVVVQLWRQGTLTGHVLDADSRQPVEGARVRIPTSELQIPRPQDAVTDQTGAFRMEYVPLYDVLHLGVEAEGYPPQDSILSTVGQGQDIDAELLLDPGVAVEVQVVEHPGGKPISCARIGTQLTDGAGRTSLLLSPMPFDGRLHFRVAASGYCALSCCLDPGQVKTGQPLVLPLVPPARFEGVVLDQEGRRIAGASVRFALDPGAAGAGQLGRDEAPLPALPDGWSYSTDSGPVTTDAEGEFTSLPLLPLRSFMVEAEHGRAGRCATNAGPSGSPGSRRWLELKLSPPVRLGTIEGSVRFNGEPLRGDWEVLWRGPGRYGVIVPDETGRFRAEDVETGPVELRVRIEDPAYGELLPGTNANVVIEPDRVTTHDFELHQRVATVGGRVTDAQGRPRRGDVVRVLATSDRLVGAASTDAEGRWLLEVPDLGLDFQALVATGQQHLRADGVHAGNKHVDFVVPASGELRVRILDALSGKPVEPWELGWRRTGEDAFRSCTIRGGLSAPLPDGSYGLELPAGGIDLIVRAHECGYRSEVVTGLAVREGTTGRVEVLLERGLDLIIELAPDVEPPPYDQVRILVLEHGAWEDVEGGPGMENGKATFGYDGWHMNGGALYPGATLGQRVLRFGANRCATIRGLHPGSWRFKALPGCVVVEPETLVLPHDGPVQLRWRPD